ncbi:unnamed protein product [Paramecium primaurelia]|uniref:Amino acid transporter transmembrane domain-containing protein n=1 Tax=Paramecium primaurelia TaxID=5886 RepID=A0A8S1MTZ9_PARPR|nr:unnamed protein product [Paramecium primaurelia]
MKIENSENDIYNHLQDDAINQTQDNLDDQGQLEQNAQNTSWFARTCGTMKKGSLRQSIIALMCAAMGSGMLSFPSNPVQSGLINSIILMIICALLSRFSMHILMKCAFKNNQHSYAELVKFALGSKMQKFYSVDMICYTFGAIVCYQILFIQFLWQVLLICGFDQSYQDQVRYIGGALFMILNFPISMMKDLYSLRYFTVVQIIIIAYILVIIIIYFFTEFSNLFDDSKIVYFDFNIELTSTFASTFFGFICHQLIFPIRSELNRSSFRRMSKIFNRAIFSELIIYLTLMIFGYLTLFQQTPKIIIDGYVGNIEFTFAQAFFAFIMFFAVPINLNPSRYTILQLIDKENNWNAYVICTVVLQYSTGIIAMIYPNVKAIFGLLGGIFGMIMVIVLPCLIYIKLELKDGKKWLDFNIMFTFLIMIVAGISGFTGAIVSQIYS